MLRNIRLDRPLDLRSTLAALRHGPSDPTIRFSRTGILRALHTPEGPATLRVLTRSGEAEAEAWGPGKEHALDGVEALLGASDDPTSFRPQDPAMRELQRRRPGLRMCRTGNVFEALLPTIIEQKVTSAEAHKSYAQLVLRWGSPAPGPGVVRLPPRASDLVDVHYFDLHPLGIERRRSEVIKEAASRAEVWDRYPRSDGPELMELLMRLPGIGAWTAAHVAQVVTGDGDIVITGDYHMPSMVSWYLAGESRGDDRRMLELLEPYRGHRGRAQRLIVMSGAKAPGHHIKRRIRSIAAI